MDFAQSAKQRCHRRSLAEAEQAIERTLKTATYYLKFNDLKGTNIYHIE
jgi:hypothetical protein